jgi:CheY-like chemotaxis protein
MDGTEFRRHQQADGRLADIPIVCLSVRDDAGQTAARLNVSELLGKPFELDAVAAAIGRHCPASSCLCMENTDARPRNR